MSDETKETVYAVVGLCLFGYGLWLAWEPLFFIVYGALFMVVAVRKSITREDSSND